jgi:hypothetical protein
MRTWARRDMSHTSPLGVVLSGRTHWPGITRMGGRSGITWAAVARSLVTPSFSRRQTAGLAQPGKGR